MPILTWKDDFSVQVMEIDLQHKKLVQMINELFDAMSAGKGNDVMTPLLKGLTSYAVMHFSTEEKYMAKYQYPGMQAHVAEHEKFKAQVSDFQSKFLSGKVTISLEVMRFLKDWLAAHIQGTDKKYSACFNEKGLR